MERSSSGVRIVQQADGFDVSEDGQGVLFYRTVPLPAVDGHARPHYIHPLFGVDGEVLTEESPPDHRHQFGIYWAWHQVWAGNKRIGDAWIQDDFGWDVRSVATRSPEGGSAVLGGEALWNSPLWTDDSGTRLPIVKETFEIKVYPAGKDFRRIDFHVELLALEEGVRIGGS
ncbi:MAG: PmoA family protein, partial [Candidatus Latescibacteria bacterium]|nr:PmoA family protein [Candidatus Latescibacterota bacterium]